MTRMNTDTALYMHRNSQGRINQNHFTGTGAGRFVAWDTPEDLLKDPGFREAVLREAGDRIRGQIDFVYEAPQLIGWDNILHIFEDAVPFTTHNFIQTHYGSKHRLWCAMELRHNAQDKILAKRTKLIKVFGVISPHRRRRGWRAINFHALRPGRDLGRLPGRDLTKELGVVMLPFGTPGYIIPEYYAPNNKIVR